MFLDLDQKPLRLKVGHHSLASHEAVQTAVFFGRVVVDGRIQREHADDGQAVPLAYRVVVGVMRGRDLDDAGAEVLVHVIVGNHRNAAAAQRQHDLLAYQVLVTRVLGVHHHGHVAQQGFRPGGGNRQRAAVGQRLACRVSQRVADVPHEAVFFLAFNFQVAHGGFQDRVPVHQAFAAVNQALLVQLDKGRGHHARHLGVHREVLVLPGH